MTRFDRLKDWPAKLKRMTVAELEAEYAYWRRRERELGHREAKQGAGKRAREVQAEIDRRAG
ncbi:MAG TPA: hypothetical protein VJU82_17130, partial [Acidobacteriaceae bacterium]|nr:hypothetical protein [Acidobacteriaceae bacterium]